MFAQVKQIHAADSEMKEPIKVVRFVIIVIERDLGGGTITKTRLSSKQFDDCVCVDCGEPVTSVNTKSCGGLYKQCGKCYLEYRRQLRKRLGRK